MSNPGGYHYPDEARLEGEAIRRLAAATPTHNDGLDPIGGEGGVFANASPAVDGADSARAGVITSSLEVTGDAPEPGDTVPIEDIEAVHREVHERTGTAFMVELPPEAPFEVVNDFMDQVADLAFGIDRDGWDPLVSGAAASFEVWRQEEANADNAALLLTEFLATLPDPHHERPGVIRAIEVLRANGSTPIITSGVVE